MKSIIFNTEMVKAILDGRKTQFRRVIPYGEYLYEPMNELCIEVARNYCDMDAENFPELKEEMIKYSKHKLYDILYVKETFNDEGWEYQAPLIFKADIEEKYLKQHWWKPSVHLKQKDARIFLKITNVRVERLDNYGLDVRKEGIREDGFYTFSVDSERERKRLFIQLWNSKAKDGYKWEYNPYVFVYEFERINKEA